MEEPKKYDKTVCALCAFQGNGNCELDRCSGTYRSDKKSVIFKKLEKVGEPVVRAKRPKGANNFGWFPYAEFQKYKVSFPVILLEAPFTHLDEDKGIVYIELKENKEDMEEKKTNFREADTPLTRLTGRYVNNLIDYEMFEKAVKELYSNKDDSKPILKKFDLEAAKSGKPVCTRDGRKARIICFDLKNDEYPIVAAVENDSSETLFSYTTNGEIADGIESDKDLMMLPEKKERWVNVYKERCYESKEEAIRHIAPGTHYIDTIRVEWEDKE